MRFQAYDIAIEIIRELRPVLERIGRRDRKLEDQARRAAASVALNLREGSRRRGRDRTQLYRVAAGSADEIVAVLDVGEAFGYLAEGSNGKLRSLLDSELAILYRLTH